MRLSGRRTPLGAGLTQLVRRLAMVAADAHRFSVAELDDAHRVGLGGIGAKADDEGRIDVHGRPRNGIDKGPIM